jgi:hypothetical protein
VFGLEKVDQKPYNSSMEMMQRDEMQFSSGGSALKFLSDQEVKTACSTILLKLAAVCSMSSRSGWSTIRSALLAKVLQKRDSHCTSTKFQLGVIRRVHELFKRPLYTTGK